MPREAEDFEALRAQLETRMHELMNEGGRPPTPGTVESGPAHSLKAEPQRAPLELRLPEAADRESFPTLEQVERDHIVRVLRACSWRISGARGAARILALNPSTLRSRIKKLGICRPV